VTSLSDLGLRTLSEAWSALWARVRGSEKQQWQLGFRGCAEQLEEQGVSMGLAVVRTLGQRSKLQVGCIATGLATVSTRLLSLWRFL